MFLPLLFHFYVAEQKSRSPSVPNRKLLARRHTVSMVHIITQCYFNCYSHSETSTQERITMIKSDYETQIDMFSHQATFPQTRRLQKSRLSSSTNANLIRIFFTLKQAMETQSGSTERE